MMKHTLLLLIVMAGGRLFAEQGYFCAPVADLLIKPIHSRSLMVSTRDAYNAISLQPQQGNYACPRSHQGLFNETVDILERHGDEVLVEITNSFFDSAFYLEHQSKYWTLAEWIISDAEVRALGIEPDELFPAAIDYRQGFFDPSVVTLLFPWYDPVSKRTYSAGTRFVQRNDCTPFHAYIVSFFDPLQHTVIESAIPKQLARTGCFDSEKESQQAFVDLLYQWIKYDQLVIPYVWGGTSFCGRTDENFSLVAEKKYHEETLAWVRPSIIERPISGFDCSGMILRAAQIMNIPYYYKNTATLSNYLRPITPADCLENGDLIWTPGHVVVVSSVERNELIESVAYSLGYGKMHVVPLNKKYRGITTWQDLIKAYYTNTPLEVLNKDGSVRSVVTLYRILKFSSAWKRLNVDKKNDCTDG